MHADRAATFILGGRIPFFASDNPVILIIGAVITLLVIIYYASREAPTDEAPTAPPRRVVGPDGEERVIVRVPAKALAQLMASNDTARTPLPQSVRERALHLL